MNKNKYDKLAKMVGGIHNTGEVIDNVFKKEKTNVLEEIKHSPSMALLHILLLPRLYEKQTEEKRATTIDFPAYNECMTLALVEMKHLYHQSEAFYEENLLIDSAVEEFMNNITQRKYQYAFVEDEGKVLDGKRVYNVVRNGDIELVKTVINHCPSLLKGRQEEIEKLAEIDPEVKELFDKTLEDMEQ